MSRGSAGRGFFRGKGGNVAVLYALGLLPIMAVIGMAVDLSRARNARLQVQDAIDAAVLAAAKLMQTKGESADVDKQVADMFKANIKEIGLEITCDAPVVTKSIAKKTLDGSVHCDLETRIMPIFGTNDLQFTRHSKAAYSINKLEVAFMFDTSGSMNDKGKISALKKSAGDAMDILFDLPVAAAGDMRIGVVSFSWAVNVGSYFKAVTDLSTPHSSLHDPDLLDAKPAVPVASTTTTCVTERDGPDAFLETPPSAGHWIRSQNDMCPVTPVVPLTSNRTTIDNAVNDLKAEGNTSGHIGIAWTWYLLSPKWNGIWPAGSDAAPYDTPALTKVAILMTDGEFNAAYESGNGTTQEQSLKMCDAMKAQGIQVFSVVFDAPPGAKDLMTKCASPGSFYAAESSADLTAAYKSIAVRISKLRIAS